MADRLKELDIAFLDTAGNVYINEPPLLIFIKGNKLAVKHDAKAPTRTFKPTGLQVIFALLCNQDLENAPLSRNSKKGRCSSGNRWLGTPDN